MAEHPNVGLMRTGYDAFIRGDMAAVRELWSEDAVWHVVGGSPLAGEHRGRDAVLGVLAKMAQLSGGTLRVELHDVLANDEHAVALVRATASREGKSLEVRESHIYHIRDGKVTEFWSFSQDQRLNDEFWS